MSRHPEETTIVKTVFLENLLLLLEGKPELSSWADQLRDIIDEVDTSSQSKDT